MIQISNLNFGYRKDRLLFKNMSMNLEPGHIYGLLGKNGAGKSTLLKNIAGLVYPLGGKLDVMGYDPAKRDPAMIGQIFFVPEELYLPAVTATAYAQVNSQFYKAFDHQHFNSLLREFDVPVNQKLINMSYGQKKKVVIAFGLAARTRLIIMDEPTNGLDIPSKAQFRKIMASELNEKRCIVISTHQVRDLDNLIDTVIMLDENQIALHASIEEITNKLCFKRAGALDDSVLYAEPSLSGFNTVVPNIRKEETKLDIELLFNAIITQKDKFQPYFN